MIVRFPNDLHGMIKMVLNYIYDIIGRVRNVLPGMIDMFLTSAVWLGETSTTTMLWLENSVWLSQYDWESSEWSLRFDSKSAGWPPWYDWERSEWHLRYEWDLWMTSKVCLSECFDDIVENDLKSSEWPPRYHWKYCNDLNTINKEF